MPGSHWLITLSPENYTITATCTSRCSGLRSRHRKKAERVAVGDRVLYYVMHERIFPGHGDGHLGLFRGPPPDLDQPRAQGRSVPVPRPHPAATWSLEPGEGLDAEALAPRLLYLKRWPPEQWYLALQGDVHLLSAQDFLLVEREMQRVGETRRSRRERVPHAGERRSLLRHCGAQAS